MVVQAKEVRFVPLSPDEVIQDAMKQLGCPAGAMDRLEAYGIGIAQAVKYMFRNFDVRLIPEEAPVENIPAEHPGPLQVDSGSGNTGQKDSPPSEPD